VAIELKVGDFQPEYKGQMELYLRWLDKYERQPNEKAPIGLILCTGKNHVGLKEPAKTVLKAFLTERNCVQTMWQEISASYVLPRMKAH
jgi:hypothetical protein